jgi:predicted RNA-binding Zn-ribbon protein involved in translation (DUF1610 family)
MRGVIKQIFIENYDEFREENKHRIRKVCDDEAKKLMRCKDINYGHILYECPKCGELLQVGFTCKSRLCTSCGKIKTDEWQNNIKNTMYNVRHRHIVFTVPEEIRDLFRVDRKLLKLLMDEAAKLMLEYFQRQRKTTKWVPGIVCVLHTFGRDLKWNPHVHMLVTEGAIVEGEEWKKLEFIKYEILRNSWKYKMSKIVMDKYGKNKNTRAKMNKIYRETENGFYVYAKPNLMSPTGIARYIGRYVSRPVIAESRIIKYEGRKVTYCYERHEDNKYVEEEITAKGFIGKMLMHVPDRQFKMVRYYGVYSRRSKKKNKKVMKELKRIMHKNNISRTFEERIKKAFGIEIFKCPNCGERMEFKDIWYYKCGSLLEKIYEKMYNKVARENKEYEKQREECA